ncbi:MAG TPA: universal stress protein [Acetobacteraceae bacterium]|jgi:nucleotide-binding universal stress UspA family protein
MALKDLLVHVDTTPRSATRTELAARLAIQHNAHLTGLHVIDIPSANYFYGAAMPFVPTNPEEIVDRIRAEAVEAARPIEAAFRECLRRNGIEGEWRMVEGSPPATVALHARYADLAIVGQPNRDEPRDADAVTVTTIMTSGRPVLAVPFAGDFPTVGERVLVAWNASREAARALNDALPLLLNAKQVTVLAINPQRGVGGHGDVPAADIALHLARQGLKTEAAHTVAKDIADGEALLSYAADIGADLIVAGAYGHSRAREMVFGGVTRTLIAEMTAPVLFSH